MPFALSSCFEHRYEVWNLGSYIMIIRERSREVRGIGLEILKYVMGKK
jgi:hypothetical protein